MSNKNLAANTIADGAKSSWKQKAISALEAAGNMAKFGAGIAGMVSVPGAGWAAAALEGLHMAYKVAKKVHGSIRKDTKSVGSDTVDTAVSSATPGATLNENSAQEAKESGKRMGEKGMKAVGDEGIGHSAKITARRASSSLLAR